MNSFGRAIPSLAILLPFLAQTEAPPTFKFVAADVANVRAAASLDSPIIARFRINTLVAEVGLDGEWSMVRANGISGFVRTDLLSAEPVRFSDALDKAAAARDSSDLKAAIQWAERAHAVDGTETVALEMLRDLQREIADDGTADLSAAKLSGEAPFHVARCVNVPVWFEKETVDSPYPVLLAEIDSAGRPQSLIPVPSSTAESGQPDNESKSFGSDLLAASWFSLGPDGLPRPLTPGVWYANGTQIIVGGNFGSPMAAFSQAGACNLGTIYTTTPVAFSAHQPLSSERIRDLSQALEAKLLAEQEPSLPPPLRIESPAGYVIQGPIPIEVVRVTGVKWFQSNYEEPRYAPFEVWGFFRRGETNPIWWGEASGIQWIHPIFRPEQQIVFASIYDVLTEGAAEGMLIGVLSTSGALETVSVNIWVEES